MNKIDNFVAEVRVKYKTVLMKLSLVYKTSACVYMWSLVAATDAPLGLTSIASNSSLVRG